MRPIDVALSLLTRLAAGEIGAREPITGTDADADAMITGLNLLAEVLDEERGRRAEAETLREDERDAYRRSPALLLSVDAESLTIVKANETLASALGVTPEDLIGRELASLFDAPERAAGERALRAAARGEPVEVPELALARAGEPLRVVTSLSLSAAPPPRLRIVWRDVTEDRRLSAQLQQAQKMLAVGRLSGGVAHDFNNLITIITASTSLIRRDLTRDDPLLEDVAVIEEAARRGAALTSQLLAFSRHQVVSPRPLALAAQVRDLHRMLGRLVPESIEIALSLPDEDLPVVMDPTQLSQVLVNLVVNARDALATEGRIEIEVGLVTVDGKGEPDGLRPGAYARLAVSDSGHGIPRDVLAHVFEPFYTTKAAGHGSGLGLSVCYGIVVQAEGRIQVHSEVGRGTTVEVLLPRRTSVATRPLPRVAAELAAGKETVLLVEDNDVLRRLTKRLLEHAGYRVIAEANGVDALGRLAADDLRVDLAITDVVMPRMSGRALAEQLLAGDRARAVLYMSGYTATSEPGGAVLDPDAPFLAKPFTAEQLLEAVHAALAGTGDWTSLRG